jgi:hypothetical protein
MNSGDQETNADGGIEQVTGYSGDQVTNTDAG